MEKNKAVDSCCEECNPAEPVEVETPFEAQGHRLRSEIKLVARRVKDYIAFAKQATPSADDNLSQNQSEMIANATLSYRHLENAGMRIGKVLQAYNGGVSILDKMRPDEGVSGDAMPIDVDQAV